MHLFPNNTLARFIVKLPSTLSLTAEQWEVGLSELQYPNMWYNIREGKNVITLRKSLHAPTEVGPDRNGENIDSSTQPSEIPITFTPGYYGKVKNVVDLINH